MKLATHWSARLKRRAKARKIWAEADKILDNAEARKRIAEADNLWGEADNLWADAVRSAYGNIALRWNWRGDALDCVLPNGDVYRGDVAPKREAAQSAE